MTYYNARYYDPDLGRFLQADTVLDGMNRYAYCGNNPVRYVDPTGMAKDGSTKKKNKEKGSSTNHKTGSISNNRRSPNNKVDRHSRERSRYRREHDSIAYKLKYNHSGKLPDGKKHKPEPTKTESDPHDIETSPPDDSSSEEVSDSTTDNDTNIIRRFQNYREQRIRDYHDSVVSDFMEWESRDAERDFLEKVIGNGFKVIREFFKKRKDVTC